MRAVSLLFHDVYIANPRESGFGSAAADRYKLALSDFDAQLQRLAAAAPGKPLLAPSLACGDENTPFLITVDDGGVSYYTLFAERLEALGWRGQCFVATAMIGQPGFLSAAQIRELDARGHVIGSHSVSHPPRFSACSINRMHGEWADSRAALEDVLGHEVRVASVPGGYYSRTVARTARRAGLHVLFTSEPTTALRDEDGILVVGRFTIRRGDDADTARRLVRPEPWTRCLAWATWNAKGVVKPLLGPSYRRVADWIMGAR
jgi:peptidoglycan/xylan/chitin deacetylase (PgdA/CDA1 family)